MSRIKSEELLAPALLCHKEPARSKQNTPLGVFCVPKPLVGGFGCDELVLYGKRNKKAGASNSSDLILDIEVEQSELEVANEVVS